MRGNGPHGEIAAASKAGASSVGDDRAEQILAAASRAIVRHGFGSTRIADIAREAGTSTGTVHYYFETKDDVLVAALTWANHESYKAFDRALEGGDAAAAKLGRLIELSIPYSGEAREWWVLWVELWSRIPHRPDLLEKSEHISARWRGYFSAVIRSGTDRGEFRPVAPLEEVVERLIALVDGIAFQVIAGHHWMPPERMRDVVLRFAAEQLRVPFQELEQGALSA